MYNTTNNVKVNFNNNHLYRDMPLIFDNVGNLVEINLSDCYIIPKNKVKKIIENNNEIKSIEIK